MGEKKELSSLSCSVKKRQLQPDQDVVSGTDLDKLHSRVLEAASTTSDDTDSPNHNTIQGQFTNFTSAYKSIPDEIKSKVRSRYDQYTSWWSNHQLDNSDSEGSENSAKRITNRTKQIHVDYDEHSFQSKKLNPIGDASITITRKHRPAVHISRDTFCYTYDVTMCIPTSENEIYDPKQVYSSQHYLGELKVPSIHHFPHFFKLFVNKDDKIENRLRGTTWHIVDDFVLRSSNISPRSHVVLLTSPAKKRWKEITEYKAQLDPVLLYNVPTLLYPEMIHMFNAIPCPYGFKATPASMMRRAQNSIREQGMIPRDVFTTRVLNCGSRSIHLSSPQFDPLNWFTQQTSQDSGQIVDERRTIKKCESTKLNLISQYNQHLRASGFDKDHSEGYLSAVEEGLTLTQLRPMEPIGRHPHRQAPVSLPKTDFSLCEMMSYSNNIVTITVPEITSFNRHAGEAYDTQWDFLFQHCVNKEALTCFSHPSNADEMSDADEDFVSGGRRAHWVRMQVVTSHLIPNHVPNGAFDSMVVMFRLLKESDRLHSLGIMFLRGTRDSECDISDESARLMKEWCFVLKTLIEWVFLLPTSNHPKTELGILWECPLPNQGSPTPQTYLMPKMNVTETLANLPDPRETGLPADPDIGGAEAARISPTEGTPQPLRALQKCEVARAGTRLEKSKKQFLQENRFQTVTESHHPSFCDPDISPEGNSGTRLRLGFTVKCWKKINQGGQAACWNRSSSCKVLKHSKNCRVSCSIIPSKQSLLSHHSIIVKDHDVIWHITVASELLTAFFLSLWRARPALLPNNRSFPVIPRPPTAPTINIPSNEDSRSLVGAYRSLGSGWREAVSGEKSCSQVSTISDGRNYEGSSINSRSGIPRTKRHSQHELTTSRSIHTCVVVSSIKHATAEGSTQLNPEGHQEEGRQNKPDQP
ncbi:hypothetical protein BLNAU_18254 [Blattamonas nauphoetae]|uniref:Uncharacterized protein n=1 Tax=Blattamonas nauphoetae TaxID=2049346 RepID=A0ABQ9X960_9EUKA|nr:hypothetical protein BLNAU_18254 [Blattamonas nauphoetae]